jgi:hypothetical protein
MAPNGSGAEKLQIYAKFDSSLSAIIPNMNENKPKRTKKPWPTKDAMEQVYEEHLWGGSHTDFYSGSGSHLLEIVEPYVETVGSFLSSFSEPLTVCDMGCGDFNVGRKLIAHTKKYVAVDIVPDLIKRNKSQFQDEHLEFHCMDLATETWPSGDGVILRNVLQHLSNAEIQRIVPKLIDFKYVILTEHIPEGDFTPNKDINSGQGIRLKKNSGVDLQAPPFNFKAKKQRTLLTQHAIEWKGLLVTTLYEMF